MYDEYEEKRRRAEKAYDKHLEFYTNTVSDLLENNPSGFAEVLARMWIAILVLEGSLDFGA